MPNCIIHQQSELEKLDKFWGLKEQYAEIWYHTNEMHNTQNNFSGRISFLFSGFNIEEFVEIVAGDNPREIESYTTIGEKEFYVRLYKGQRFLGYQIDSIQVHQDNYVAEDIEKKLQDIIFAIEKSNEKIFRFTSIIRQYGIRSYSMDFTVSDRGITFIDWDTSDDERILKYERI